jgi:hypothetical protein
MAYFIPQYFLQLANILSRRNLRLYRQKKGTSSLLPLPNHFKIYSNDYYLMLCILHCLFCSITLMMLSNFYRSVTSRGGGSILVLYSRYLNKL